MSQLDIVRAVQELWNPWLTFFFEVITTFGGPIVYVVIAPLVFWLWDTRLGYRFAVLVLLSVWLNSAIKEIAPLFLSDQGPLYVTRPFAASADVLTCISAPRVDVNLMLAELCKEEETLAFPSGHAQTALVFWAYLTLIVRRWHVTLLAVIATLLIGLSRIYLGQHWPTDVVGGYAIGAAWLAVGLILFARGARRPVLLTRVLLALMLVSSVVLLWLDPDPTFNRSRALGLLAGASIGYSLYLRAWPFAARGSRSAQLGKLLLGLIGVGVFYGGLGALAPDTTTWKFTVAAVAGLWAFGIAPLIFARLWPADRAAHESARTAALAD
jgi:membrane-associated phospholipid phosphatase